MRYMMLILSFFLLIIFSVLSNSVQADYELLVGTDQAYFHTFNISNDGMISTPPKTFHFNIDNLEFFWPQSLQISKNGNFVFVNESDKKCGALLRATEAFDLSMIRELRNGCSGGGFSPDEQFFITTTKFLNSETSGTLVIYERSGDYFDIITTQTVATTATLAASYLWDSKDNVIGSMSNSGFGLVGGGNIYHFNRDDKHLELSQHFSKDPVQLGGYCFMNHDENLLTFIGYPRVICSMVRSISGLWELRDSYWNPSWSPDTDFNCPKALAMTPYTRKVAFLLEPTGGVAILSVSPEGKLSSISKYPIAEAQQMVMSPDGKYLAIAHNFAQTLSTFRLNTDGTITLIDSVNGPAIAAMSFFPNRVAPAAVKRANWQVYGETNAMNSPSAKPSAASVTARSVSPKRVEWKHVEVGGKKQE